MSAIDLETEYNNRARVPEHPAIFERWRTDAAAFRAAHANAELGLAYGASERAKIDIFWSTPARDAPIALFISTSPCSAISQPVRTRMASR